MVIILDDHDDMTARDYNTGKQQVDKFF